MSALSTGDTPVGADFFTIGEHGHDYGAFGELFLMNNHTGHGYYRCKMDPCVFCPDGITADKIDYINGDETFGHTCGTLFNHAKTLESKNDIMCREIISAEKICCPSSTNDEL